MLSRRAMMNDEVVSANGKDLLLQKCKGSYLHGMKVYGRTTQQTTTGAQLFDGTYTKDAVLTVEGNISSYSGRSASGFVKVNANTTYIGFTPWLRVVFYDAEKNTIDYSDETTEYRTTPDGTEFLRFNFINGEENNTMINKGTKKLPYESYTGGIPSPNPDYPQELVSAGDKGSIEVVATGKNLFDIEQATIINANLATGTISDGIITVVTNTEGKNGYIILTNAIELSAGVTYYVTAETISASPNAVAFLAFFNAGDIGSYIEGKTHTPTENISVDIGIYVNGDIDVGDFIKITNIMVTSDKDADYEPYRTPQTLTLSTPNGLPGIPVSSGGNYTDETGQQWIADYRDWERGVDVQKVWKGVFDGSSDEEWSVYDNPTYFGFYLMNALPINADGRNGYCNQFRVDAIGTEIDNGLWIGASGNKYIYVIRNSFYDDTLEDKGLASWKAHLAEQPLVVMTYLDIPIETPIPAEELAVYRALHTNTPTTTITNDEDCHMEVGYRRIRG